MIKLKDLIFEQGAGEEAKKRGLKSIGFGRYVDPSNPGIVIAKSVGGKLVAVDKGKETPSDSQKSPQKPSRNGGLPNKVKTIDGETKPWNELQPEEPFKHKDKYGTEFTTNKAVLQGAANIGKLVGKKRTAKDAIKAAYVRSTSPAPHGSGKLMRIKSVTVNKDGTLEIEVRGDRFVNMRIDGHKHENLQFATRESSNTRPMPSGAVSVAAAFFPEAYKNI